MVTLTVTAKGQVTLRREVLEHLGVGPGDKLAVDVLPGGRVEVRGLRPAGAIAAAFGRLHRPCGPVLSVEEMSEIAAAGWAGADRDEDGSREGGPDGAARAS